MTDTTIPGPRTPVFWPEEVVYPAMNEHSAAESVVGMLMWWR